MQEITASYRVGVENLNKIVDKYKSCFTFNILMINNFLIEVKVKAGEDYWGLGGAGGVTIVGPLVTICQSRRGEEIIW